MGAAATARPLTDPGEWLKGKSLTDPDAWMASRTTPKQPEHRGFWGSLLDTTGLPQMIEEAKKKPIPKSTVDAIKNAFSDALENMPPVQAFKVLHGMAVHAGEHLTDAGHKLAAGDFAGAADAAATGIPIIGPAAERARAQADSGDTVGALGTIVGTVAPLALGAAGEVPGMARAAETALSKVPMSVAKGVGGAMGGFTGSEALKFMGPGPRMAGAAAGWPAGREAAAAIMNRLRARVAARATEGTAAGEAAPAQPTTSPGTQVYSQDIVDALEKHLNQHLDGPVAAPTPVAEPPIAPAMPVAPAATPGPLAGGASDTTTLLREVLHNPDGELASSLRRTLGPPQGVGTGAAEASPAGGASSPATVPASSDLIPKATSQPLDTGASERSGIPGTSQSREASGSGTPEQAPASADKVSYETSQEQSTPKGYIANRETANRAARATAAAKFLHMEGRGLTYGDVLKFGEEQWKITAEGADTLLGKPVGKVPRPLSEATKKAILEMLKLNQEMGPTTVGELMQR